MIEKSGEWDLIQHGEYLIENCTWNVKAASSKWQQIIFYDTIKGACGWKWNFSREKDDPNNYVIKSYPEIIYGRKPYNGYKSTTDRLPISLNLAKFWIEYDYSAKASGIYNTTTDISFTDNDNPVPANIRAKLMIWFDHHNMDFFKSKTLKHAIIGGLKHEIFIDTNHTGPEGKWIFIALLPNKMPSKGKLDLNEYLSYLLAQGTIRPEWFLSSIEIGSEVASGKGEVVFKRFVIKIH